MPSLARRDENAMKPADCRVMAGPMNRAKNESVSPEWRVDWSNFPLVS
jgi:hypothetical protein